LVTGEPQDLYTHCVGELSELVERGVDVIVSNQVIGEAYVTLQHHYGTSKEAARMALLGAFESALVAPQGGEATLDALRTHGGPGLMDRLIVEGYLREGLSTLTLDRRMATLTGARGL
jgi:predicted nucleic acid-binding protein